MTTVTDPVHRVRYSFQPDGENLIVDTWIEPGGGLPAHLHPRQEERWSVLDGEVRFQLGETKRVIGPEDGEMVVRPQTKHAIASVSDREAHLRCVVVPAYGLQGFLDRERRRRPRGPVHARRDPEEPARRPLGGALPQAAPRGRRDVVPAAVHAARDDRAARPLARSGRSPRRQLR